MQINDLKIYKGRNIYSHRKVIRMIVDLEEWNDIPTNKIKGFNDSLLTLLPGLKKHRCSLGYEGGFKDRLFEGTYLAHVIEHTAIEILNSIGHDISFGRARQIGDSSKYTIIFSFLDENAGSEAGKLAVSLVDSLCNKKDFDINKGFDKIKRLLYRHGLGPSTQSIVNAAVERGIPVTRIGEGSIIQLGYGKYSKKMEGTLSDSTSCISADMASNKSITKDLLSLAGIPVPKGIVCYNLEETLDAVMKIKVPVVIKPVNGNQGKGVSLNLETEDEVKGAFNIAKQFSDNIIVEEYIKGNDYRVLIVGDQVSAVALRIPAYIIGNGKCTIKELVDLRNSDCNRGEGHEKPLTKIQIDDISLNTLKKQGYGLNDIPLSGIKVYLKNNGNLSTGGEAIDCTDRIHPYNQELTIRVARIIGLDIAGIDITCHDISKPLSRDNGVVIEVNAAPGLRMHLFPSKGKPREVGNAIVDMLYPSGNKHSIPIISITGTNGKTTTTRMVGHILKVNGMNVGMTTTSGIYINDQCILKGDTTGATSAQILLSDKTIDIAVLETARGGIIRSGLGYDLSDVGVLMNISEDHLGIDGVETLDDLFYVKSLVVEAVKSNGNVILNADDKMVIQAAKFTKANIIYFSMEEDNIIVHKHIAEGGIAVFVRDGYIILATGNGLVKSLAVKQIPSTYGGKLVHNIENCLAAFCVAYALNTPLNIIENGLTSFYCDEIHNPGRFNIYNIRDFRVIVDYGHNVASYQGVAEALKELGSTNIIGVIGVPGDRNDISIKRIGEISGQYFNKIIVKEDKDLRGRDVGEVAKILKKGILSSGMPNKNIKIALNEAKALKLAMDNASAGDIIVVFYEDLEAIMDIINSEISRSVEDKELKQEDLKAIKA